MKTLAILLCVAVLAAALFANSADACGRRRRRRRGQTSRVVVTPRNPPLRIPPTPNPTPPPPPPPIPTGWVPPPPRPPAQEMTRTNCKARVEFTVLENENSATTDVVDRSQIQEQWVYTCTFQVYVEVDVSEVNNAAQCACGVALSRQHPPHDPTFSMMSYGTEITSFSMVAFDVVRNVVVGVFPPETFDELRPNANTTAMLENQAASNAQNYELTAKGYSGLIKNLGQDKFPSALIPGRSDYTLNNVPAMCFTVEEKFISGYKWPQPPFPHMSSTPNVWVSQCYPYFDYAATTARKRSVSEGGAAVDPAAPNQRYWFKEFLLFPLDQGSSAGFNAKARYITSWYVNSNCDQSAGVVSFDREFDYTLERETRYSLFGAFAWARTFSSTWVVGGVPKSFSSAMSFFRRGHTKVTWNEVYGRDDKLGAFRPGVVYHALLGTAESPAGQPFIGAGPRLKLCSKVPSAWANCQPGAGAGCADLRTDTYDENAYFFQFDHTSMDEMDCRPAMQFCAQETTFLSFQNFGNLARDYSKRKGSILLTGSRMAFCLDYPPSDVFDSLYFRPYTTSSKLIRKRAVQQGADNMLAGVNGVTGTSDGGVKINAESVREPEAFSQNVQPAAGSADTAGRAGGDHPIALFPETYTVPVTLNPRDTTLDGAVGTIFDGELAPCLEGTRGCTCRTTANRPACDAPLECNDSTSFCEPPTCIAGQAGCACGAGQTCSDSTLSCDASGMCVFAASCDAGDNGCVCKADSSCTDAKASCTVDNVCLVTGEGDCDAGASGCECTADGACSSATDVCDEVANVCVSPTCEAGQPGCECSDERCRAGFSCTDANVCVQSTCPAGQPGCACATDGDACAVEGFECKAFTTDGSDSRCVAKGKNCGDQTARCVKYCGVGRVLKCPACSHQRPVCDGAANLAPAALVAALLAVLALLF